jgi:zinc/manganese transport system permease protein
MIQLLAVAQAGFFADEPVRVALAVGTVVAIVAGAVGVFTVMRGQSFAGEALGDLGATGGSGAFLLGIGPLWGFLAMGIVAAGVMELIGIQRPRGRDLATGIVLGAGLGLAALFLYWDSTLHNTTGATITILFGSVFAISSSTFPLVAILGVVALGIVVALYRPLLLSTISAEMAAARGVPVRVVGAAYLLALAMTVALAAVTIGAILSTALLIGPAASALRLTRRPGRAMLAAGAIGIVAVWLGVALAYESYYWPPAEHGWPVSFFVVTLIFLFYIASGVPAWRDHRRADARRVGGLRIEPTGLQEG